MNLQSTFHLFLLYVVLRFTANPVQKNAQRCPTVLGNSTFLVGITAGLRKRIQPRWDSGPSDPSHKANGDLGRLHAYPWTFRNTFCMRNQLRAYKHPPPGDSS
ncbi:hypothetical protein B0H11DRAFT_472826 [Mycena galericulata]|nr:hypothetical protein B0H11DRAFT_472826 [Mycena galericulata]